MEKCLVMAERSINHITMLETGKMTKNMAKEHLSGLLAQATWVHGKMTCTMVQEFIQIKKAKSSKENG